MATWTTFKALSNLSHSGEPKGTIADTPCSGFQWSYDIVTEYDTETVGLGFGSGIVYGKLRVQITDENEAEVLFDQTVIIKYTIVTLDLGGLTLFTWYIDQNYYEHGGLVTAIPSAHPPVFGSEQPYFDPAAGTDYTDHDILLGWTYTSGKYLIPLPSGAKFKVRFHNEGMAGLRFVPVKTSVLPLTGLAALYDRVGIHRFTLDEHAHLKQVWSADGGRSYWRRRVPTYLTYPSLAKMLDNSLLLAGKRGEAEWELFRSLNDGLTWETALVLWAGTYQDADIVTARDGATITIARLHNVLYCKSSRDSYVSSYLVGPATRAMRLTCHQQSGRLTATDGNTSYVSDDNGVSWEQRELVY